MAKLVNFVACCLLIALVAHDAEAIRFRSQMGDYCARVDKKLAKHEYDRTNSAITYDFAIKQVMSVLNSGSWERFRLANAWWAVTFDGQCKTESLDFLSTIYDCGPERLDTLKDTLAKDTRAYVVKCFKPEWLSKKLKKALSWWNDNPRQLEKFIDQDFLDSYRASNRDEPMNVIEVSPVAESDEETTNSETSEELELNDDYQINSCCRPERSTSLVVKAILAGHGKRADEARKNFKRNPNKIETYLKGHLFKPCELFLKATFPLMRGTKAASHYFEGKQAALFGAQSQEFQDALFRYEFCQHLRVKPIRERLITELIEAFVLPEQESDGGDN